MIRIELWKRGGFLGSGHIYNMAVTRHALLIIFFIIMPTLLGGFGNYLVPLILGVPDLIYPRLNLLR
jgi:heme/copper-type cytochrome/quinol oxidase subunit 1